MKLELVSLGIIILIAFVAWYGSATYDHWRCSIPLETKVKVSRVSISYDYWADSKLTVVLGFDGDTQLAFFGDISGFFEPNHEYLIKYHGGSRGIFPQYHYVLDNVTEITP